jgi:hypothetical protein
MRAGRGLASTNHWQILAYNNEFIWGEFPNARQNSIQTFVSRLDMTVACSCNSRKFPCRHGIGLLLLAAKRPSHFSRLLPEGWLAQRIERHRLEQQRKQQQLFSQKVPTARQHDKQEQFTLLQTGMTKLELWLQDLVRHGLAVLPDRTKQFWIDMAHQMVDAEAPEIAHQLRQMSTIPLKQPDWADQYLQKIGELFLLIQGFKQFTSQPIEMQTDLKAAVGWFPPPFTQIGERIEDDWLVLGHLTRNVSSRSWLYTWLWGIDSNRPAAVLQILQQQRASAVAMATGNPIRGVLHFDKSHWPLFAHMPMLENSKRPFANPQGFTTISDAMSSYNNAIAHRPWIGAFPLLLHKIRPVSTPNGFFLIDNQGFLLSVATPFLYRWHLEAISGGDSLSLFGVWDGRFFAPLSINTDQGWRDLHIFRGIK